MNSADRTVIVHVRCTTEDGTVVESSHGLAPLRFSISSSSSMSQGTVFPAIAEAVEAIRQSGTVATVQVEIPGAYGSRRDDLLFPVPVDEAPPGLAVGQRVRLGRAPAMVAAVDARQVLIDANHPLAGRVLRFEIELAENVAGAFSPYSFIEQAPWRFASTMPHIPHWYTVRGQTPEDEFEACVRYIREHGYTAAYRGPSNNGRVSRHTYTPIANWKYWTMGAPVEETTIINRAAIHARPPWVWEPIEPKVEKLTAEEAREDCSQIMTGECTWTAI